MFFSQHVHVTSLFLSLYVSKNKLKSLMKETTATEKISTEQMV